MIQAYSRAEQGAERLSPHFRAAEFASRDGADPIFVDEKLVWVLQALRSQLGVPLRITSGYRTPAHNAAVGGTARSQHLYGRAADIQAEGLAPAQVAAAAEALLDGTGGIGLYPPGPGRPNGWVHIDTRPAKSRWKG